MLSLLLPVSLVVQESLHSVPMPVAPNFPPQELTVLLSPKLFAKAGAGEGQACRDIPGITIPGLQLPILSPSWLWPSRCQAFQILLLQTQRGINLFPIPYRRHTFHKRLGTISHAVVTALASSS